MRYFIFLSVFIAGTASAQQYINPTLLGQPGDIILQNTNVYYSPMAPPDSTDVRDSLSNLGSLLVDPNGVGNSGAYAPRTHDTNLQSYKPCDTCAAYGPHAIWQRLFTARDKQNQSLPDRHSDIIVGDSVTDSIAHGPVIISKNEDVDFRASGTIKMESGFHVMPGAFFDAYIEPRWPSTTVFSDEFTDSTLDRSKWTVANGPNVYYQTGVECSSDSNVRDTADPDAHDGHALDIILREVPDTCICYTNVWPPSGTCDDSIRKPFDANYFIWSTAVIHSCPWPYTDAGDSVPGYQQTPYGKYEYREKIPHTKHHTNNWGCCDSYNINETWNGDMSELHPGVGAPRFYGPFTGSFGHKVIRGNNVWVFRSSGPDWCASNNPICLNIYGFKFNVAFDTSANDPCIYASGGPQFPFSYVNRGGEFPFTYQRSGLNQADTLQWKVSQDGSGNWRILSCGYHDSSGHLLHFSKDYQPNQIAISNSLTHEVDTINCHWDYSLNTPTDHGLLWLNTVLAGADSNVEPFYYWVDENNFGPAPPYAFDGENTSGGYAYHTFGMELLPNRAVFFLDSNVVYREPDRMVPPTSKFFGVVSQIRRYPVIVYPSEIDIDGGNEFDSSYTISGGDTDWTSIGYGERHYFEMHPHNPGFWDVTIGGKTYHAAHHLIDYVKIWDVPADVKITPFPN